MPDVIGTDGSDRDLVRIRRRNAERVLSLGMSPGNEMVRAHWITARMQTPIMAVLQSLASTSLQNDNQESSCDESENLATQWRKTRQDGVRREDLRLYHIR